MKVAGGSLVGEAAAEQRDWPGVVVRLRPAPDPEDAFGRLARRRHCVFFDSAQRGGTVGRYSFLSADPFEWFEVPVGRQDALEQLASRVRRFAQPPLDDLPPFQGGAAGVLAYDLNRSLERVPVAEFDEFGFPAIALGFYDIVVAWDHQRDEAWIVSQGWPEVDPAGRRRRAQERAEQFCSWLQEADGRRCDVPAAGTEDAQRLELSAPQFPAGAMDGLLSNFSRPTFCEAVRRAIDYIFAGDVFQVNLAQRLVYPARVSSPQLYGALRRCNPAPFAAYFDTGRFQVLSASPERFLRVSRRRVETRPIKGTRPRTRIPQADMFAGRELLDSEKDRAENIMIVDLLRNDLSRVCRPESVQVAALCRLEVYAYVQHLVSVVCGELAEGRELCDLIAATFPGGSITGAPKVRAMEIIAELERTARGPYCGCVGYLGFDGSMDLNILIRTITAGGGWWQLPVGGGIVAQSEPEREYEETWHKAAGLLRAIRAVA